MDQDKMEEFNSNIIKWYPFESTKAVLQIGNNNIITKELKNICQKIKVVGIPDLNEYEEEKYDYVIIYGYERYSNIIEKVTKLLKEDGKLIIIGNNEFGINNWSKYNDVLKLEEYSYKENTVKYIKQKLKEKEFENINTFFAFPNYQYAEIIVNESTYINNGCIEKYKANLEEDKVKIFNENNILKNILLNDPKMIEFFANSYFIEASKEKTELDVKMVSYNNCRKEEYRLITIIEDKIVKKITDNPKAQIHIDEMSKIIKDIKNDGIETLDYVKDGIIYSSFYNGKTIDEVLNENYNNFEKIIGILDGLKAMLIKKSIKYEECKEKVNSFGFEIEKIKKLHFLKNAYWDMIAKNCFLIDEKYVFFDQEWKAEYLPVEFLIYRSIINSYDLVKKIDVNELLKKLVIFEYKEYFQVIDDKLRTKIIDKDIYIAMYEKNIKGIDNLINDKKIAEQYLKQEQEDNRKKQTYINELEEDSAKKQKYINELEEDSTKKQKYIEALEVDRKNKEEYIKILEEKTKRRFFGKGKK